MPRAEAITVAAVVIEVMASGVYRVELPNGHRLLGHPTRKLRMSDSRLAVGERITVEMSPFDMSKGSITVREEK